MAISKITTNSVGAGTITQPLMGTNVAGNGPAFSAYQSTAQANLTASTYTKILFQTEEFDTNNNFDSTTNYRFTPTVAGYYQINSLLSFLGTPAVPTIIIYKNGAVYKYGVFFGGGVANPSLNVSSVVYLNGSTDYVEIYAYTTTAGITMQTGASPTYFNGAMIRSA